MISAPLAGGHTRQRSPKWFELRNRHGTYDPPFDGGSPRLRAIEILANERRPGKQFRRNYTEGKLRISISHFVSPMPLSVPLLVFYAISQ